MVYAFWIIGIFLVMPRSVLGLLECWQGRFGRQRNMRVYWNAGNVSIKCSKFADSIPLWLVLIPNLRTVELTKNAYHDVIIVFVRVLYFC